MTEIFYWSNRILAALGEVIIIPVGIGMLFFPKDRKDGFISYIMGLFAELTLFELIYLPCFFLDVSFSGLTAVFQVLAAGMALGGFLLAYKYRSPIHKEKTPLSSAEKTAVIIGAIVVVYQFARVTFGAGTWNIDDGWYLAIANNAIESDRVLRFDVVTGLPLDYSGAIKENVEYIFSPWPLFWATIARVTEIKITALMRSVLPGVFIILFYMLVYRFALFIFGNNREKALIAGTSLAVFFEITGVAMNVSHTWMLCYPWMGKGFGPSIICPAVLLLFLMTEEETDSHRRRLLWLGVFLGNVAGCVAASSCAELNLLALGCWGLSYIIRRRDLSALWKLALCVLPSMALTASHVLL
ncbi:MAG: DUF6077 domain-containing protein [Eubacteriales bacterium]|nr:DUF6077 domain-containing protein [Eubacteriales bacterium]